MMPQRFFVTVIAPSLRALKNLRQFELDLFLPTTKAGAPMLNARKAGGQAQHTIEGLLTLEEVGKLVEHGYQVLVEDEMSKRARAHREVIEFSDWIKGMEE